MEKATLRQAFESNTTAFIRLTDALLVSDELRRRFNDDPAATLEHIGFKFRDAAALNEFVKGIKEAHQILVPGSDVMNVAVGVWAGTRPAVSVGTEPAVAVVVHVASQGKPGDRFEDLLDPERVYQVDGQRFGDAMRVAELEAEVERLRAEVARLGAGR